MEAKKLRPRLKDSGRRPKGQGAMKLNADGTRTYTYLVPKEFTNGKRVRIVKTIPPMSLQEANEIADEIRVAARIQKVEEQRLKQKFNAFADEYLDEKAKTLQRTTVDLYRRNLAVHFRPVFGERFVQDITRAEVVDMLRNARDCSRTKKKGQLLSDNVRDNLRVELRALLEWGTERAQNPLNENVAAKVKAKDIKSPTAAPKPPSFIRTTNVQELVATVEAAAVGSEVENLVPFAIRTGMRRGELCALRWSDVDMQRGKIHIWRAFANVDVVKPAKGKLKREVIVKTPKSAKSARTIKIGALTLGVLKRHRLQQRQAHLAAGVGNRGDDALVFERADGRPWNPNELSRVFCRAMRAKDVAHVKLHDLRHMYASLAYAGGAKMKRISEHLGHASLAITMEVYVHLFDGDDDSTDRVDAFIGADLLSA